MIRQYNVVLNSEYLGKMTVKCKRGKYGGWIATPHFRGKHSSFYLTSSPEMVNKIDAIEHARLTLLENQAIEGYRLIPLENAKWCVA